MHQRLLIVILLSLILLMQIGTGTTYAQDAPAEEAPPPPPPLAIQDNPNLHMIAIEALVIEINEERTRDLGLTYGFTEQTRLADGTIINEGPRAFEGGNITLGRRLTPVRVPVLIKGQQGLTDIGFQDRLPGIGVSLVGMNISGAVFSAQLRALLERGDALIRTRPIATALNNTMVRIEAIDEVPYLDRKSNRNLEVTFDRVGVKVQVKPRIENLRRRIINLDIGQMEVSSVSQFITTEGVERPVFNTSNTNTNVTLNEGETFVVGSLKTRRRTRQFDQVPILGRIPVLGHLFRSRQDLDRNVDVLFFITPYILRPGENFLVPFDFRNQQALGIDIGVQSEEPPDSWFDLPLPLP